MSVHVKASEAGFSPVEMLVGMAIGMLLLLGVGQVVLHQRTTMRTQEELSRMEDAGRFALFALARSIRQAGFRPSGSTAESAPFPADGTFQEDAFIGLGIGTSSGRPSLTLRYYGLSDGSQINCLGVDTKTPTLQVEQWSQGQGSLQCTTLGSTQPLVPSLEEMQFTLGLDRDGDGTVDATVAAEAVDQWAKVASVHVYLRLVSQEDGLADGPQAYQDAQGGTAMATDRRLRRTFRNTVSLRQPLP